PFPRCAAQAPFRGPPTPPPAADSIVFVAWFGDGTVPTSCRLRDADPAVVAPSPLASSPVSLRGRTSREQLVDGIRRFLDPLLQRPFHETPRPTARPRMLEVALVHPASVLLELADAVVAPRHVEPADDEKVVRPVDEFLELGCGDAEVELVEHRRGERVRVGEQHAARERCEEVLVPALHPRDVRELPARPGRIVRTTDLRVGPPV